MKYLKKALRLAPSRHVPTQQLRVVKVPRTAKKKAKKGVLAFLATRFPDRRPKHSLAQVRITEFRSGRAIRHFFAE